MTPARFPHSDTPGSTLGCQLPRAYRRLLRPSSALDAKASTTCPSQLVTHTTTPTPNPHHPHHRTHPTQHRQHRGRTNGTERHRHGTRAAAHNTPQKNNTPPPTITARACTTQQTTTKQTSSQPPPRPTRHTPVQRAHTGSAQAHGSQPPDARVHYPDLKQQPQTPRARTPQRTPRRSQVPKPQTTPAGPAHAAPTPRARFLRTPTACLPMFHILRHHHRCTLGTSRCVLLRKEVIQPHLPVRLPCYDFVPIASPTFDHSLRRTGWAVGFGCCRLS